MKHRLATTAVLVLLTLVLASCSDPETLQSGPTDDPLAGDVRAAPADADPEGDLEEEEAEEPDTAEASGGSEDTDRPDRADGGEVGGSEDAATADADPETPDTENPEMENPDTETPDTEDPETENPETEDAETGVSDTENAAVADVALVTSGPGDSGDHVMALQERLAELGFSPGTPDGSFGRRTAEAIIAFQELIGLNETGRADARTLGALAGYRYDGLVLETGDEGELVETLQQRLADGPFDPGAIDGVYGTGTTQAVWALEKMAGIPIDGNWGPLDERAWEQLEAGLIGQPEKSHDQRWVEVDLSEQIMKVYDPGTTVPVLVSHASSGSGVPWENEEFSGSSVTPLGDFHIDRRINGWRESSLNIGRLYNPLYFNGGIAFHGATSVPLHPASHGCIRLPMHVADYLPDELPNGTPVHILS